MAICHKVHTYYKLVHYTFMSIINLQNLGPIWKVFCLVNMGVEIPVAAVVSILDEQDRWDIDKLKRCNAKSYHKR